MFLVRKGLYCFHSSGIMVLYCWTAGKKPALLDLISRVLMALKIIKRLFAVQAAVQRLAGGGAKLADHFGMPGTALQAFHHSSDSGRVHFVDAAVDGRGDAVIFEPLPPRSVIQSVVQAGRGLS